MKLKDLEDFEYFRCHPAGRLLFRTGIIHQKKGHQCMAVSYKTTYIIGKNGNKIPAPSDGETFYYPPGLNVYREPLKESKSLITPALKGL